MLLDLDAFAERAAIMEIDGGLTRYEAETLAAQAQGVTRWQALAEVRNAERVGHPKQARHQRQAAERHGARPVPAVQRQSAASQIGPMSERHVQAGRSAMDVLALRMGGR